MTCLVPWVWKAINSTCLTAFSGEISLFLESLQSSLAWTQEQSNNIWLFILLQSQTTFSSTYPRKLSWLSPRVTHKRLWLCLHSGCCLSPSLCFFGQCNAKPLHAHISNFGVAAPVFLHGQEDTCWGLKWPLLTTYFQKMKQFFLSWWWEAIAVFNFMIRRCHDMKICEHRITWQQLSILRHWAFLWLRDHRQLHVWRRVKEHNGHTWWNEGQSGLPLVVLWVVA